MSKLLEKLLEEKDIIASSAIIRARELCERHFDFTITESSRKVFAQYYRNSNVVEIFIDECLNFSDDAKVYKKDIIEVFKKFCSENGFEIKLSNQVLLQKIGSLPCVESAKGRIDGGKPLALFKGVGLKEGI